jgi:hypothetical protein
MQRKYRLLREDAYSQGPRAGAGLLIARACGIEKK